MRWHLLLLLVTLLVSCSPEERLARLLARHPELTKRDTIRDTVWATVEYVHADTVFVPVPGDTVRIDNGRLHIKYVKMPGDTVWIDGECDADSVRVPFEVVVEKSVPCPEGYKVRAWWKTAALILGGLFLLLLLLLLAIRRSK